MHSRRGFLSMSAGAGALMVVGTQVFAQGAPSACAAIAITEVFGEGAKLIAVAVEYDTPLRGEELDADVFSVEGRTVTGVFTSTSADPAHRADEGRFAIVTLSPDDPNALLARRIEQPGGGGNSPGGGRGPGHAGDIPNYARSGRRPQPPSRRRRRSRLRAA